MKNKLFLFSLLVPSLFAFTGCALLLGNPNDRVSGATEAQQHISSASKASSTSSAYRSTSHRSSNPRTKKTQRLLTDQGYEPGPIDGLMGNKTRRALKAFQTDNGLVVNGRIDKETYTFLTKETRRSEGQEQVAKIITTAPKPKSEPDVNYQSSVVQAVKQPSGQQSLDNFLSIDVEE